MYPLTYVFSTNYGALVSLKAKTSRLITAPSDRFLRSLPPAKRGHMRDIWDTRPRLRRHHLRRQDRSDAARQSPKDQFHLYARFGGRMHRRPGASSASIRRCLEEARRKAGMMAQPDRQGHRPAELLRRQKPRRQRARRNCASSIRSPALPKNSSPTSWRRNAAASSPSVICATPSSPHGASV